MRRKHGCWLAGLAAVVALGAQTLLADILKSDDLVAVCGDSITEQKDYSVDIEAYLLMCRAGGAGGAGRRGRAGAGGAVWVGRGFDGVVVWAGWAE